MKLNNINSPTNKISNLQQKDKQTTGKCSHFSGKSQQDLIGSLNLLATLNRPAINKQYSTIIDREADLPNCLESRPLNHISELSPENMLLVHVSNYFPENGIIRCAKTFGIQEDGTSKTRSTVHFSINNISPELTGDPNWKDKKYAILIPADKLFENGGSEDFLGGCLDDLMHSGDVEIPNGSTIIKYNAEIPDEKLKISYPFQGREIILIETSNPNMEVNVNDITKKLGYTPIETNSYTEDRIKSWSDFCDQYNLLPCCHSISPWGKAEHMIDMIFELQYTVEDSWLFELSDSFYESLNSRFHFGANYFTQEDNTHYFNFKDVFLSEIEVIKEQMPSGKKLSYDIDKLAKIIEKSQTPSEACELIKKELKLTSVKKQETIDEIQSDFSYPLIILSRAMDMFLLSKESKELAKGRYNVLL